MSNNKKLKQLEKELRKYKKLSFRDTLTGLYNRRKLEQDINRYLELQYRYKTNFLVLMFDVDNFKKINDSKGHPFGDKALKRIANIIEINIRKIDKAYRLSGDEFIVILSHCKKDKITNRIKKDLEKYNIEISYGCNKLCDNVLDIIDKKMYENKRSKR